jgi:cell division protein FtsX
VMAFMLLLTLGLSILLTRLYLVAGGSVLVVALAHASFNAFGDRLSDSAHLSGDPFLVSVGGLLGFALMAIVIGVIWGWRRSHRKVRHSRGPTEHQSQVRSAALGT